MAIPSFRNLGAASGSGSIDRSSTYTLTATPSAGHKFTKFVVFDYYISMPNASGVWRRRESTNNPYTMPGFSYNDGGAGTWGTTMVEFKAYFALKTYSVQVKKSGGTGGATVSIDGGGTSKSVTHGTTYSINATWGNTDRFTRWDDGDGTALRTGISATGNKTYTAQFSNIKVTVSRNNGTYGTVSLTTTKSSGISSSFVASGESVTMRATVTDAAKYKFVRWEQGGSQKSTNANYTLSSHSGNKTYTAIFEKIGSVSVSKNTPGINTATVNGGASVIADDNTNVSLYASAVSGYVFVRWVDGNGTEISTEASYSMKVSNAARRNVTAIFASTDKPITLLVDDPVWGDATIMVGKTDHGKEYSIPQGQSCTLVATPAEFGTFGGWSVNNSVISTDNPATLNWDNADPVEITAIFVESAIYEFELESEMAAGGPAIAGCELRVAAGSEQQPRPQDPPYQLVLDGSAVIGWSPLLQDGTKPITMYRPQNIFDQQSGNVIDQRLPAGAASKDQNASTYWLSNHAGAYVVIDLGEPRLLHELHFFNTNNGNAGNGGIGDFEVYGANAITGSDPSDYDLDSPAKILDGTLDAKGNTNANPVPGQVFGGDDGLDTSNTYRYIKLETVSNYGTPGLCELRVFLQGKTYELQPNERYGGPVVVEAVSANGHHLAQLEMVMGGVTANTLAKTVTPTNLDLESWGLKSTWKWGDSLDLTVKGDTTITGTFAKDTYVIGFGLQDETPVGNQVSAEWGETIINITTPYNGIDGLEYGTYVKLMATPGGGDSFRGWYNSDGEFISNEAVFRLRVTKNVFYKARFGNVVNLSVNNSDPGSVVGKVLPSGSESDIIAFTYGDEVEITAIPDEGKFFGGWYLGGKLQPGMLATHRFFPDGAVTYEAHFSDGKSPVLVHLTNGAQGGFGRLSFIVPNGIAETELMDATAWHNRLETLTGAVELPSPIGYGDPETSGADSYWELDDITEITLRCDPVNPNAVFDRWEIAYINVEDRDPGVPGYSQGDYYDFDNIQHLSSSLLTNVSVATHCIIRAKWRTDEPQQVTVGYFSGSNASMGAIDLTPRGDEWKGPPTIQSKYRPGRELTVLALPNNGYKFMGWYKGGQVLTTDSQYVFEVPSEPIELLARFAQDKDAVYLWEGGQYNKWMSWISKRFVTAKPLNMTSARVYADGYPVELTVHTSSSPDAPRGNGRKVMIQVERQDARRLPRLRPEKYIELEIQGQDVVQEAAISTSMEGLLQ